jgi:hypothetical protein
MSLSSRRRVLAAKIETTCGTAVSLSATDAALNVFDLKMDPDIEVTERPGQGSFAHLPVAFGAYKAKCTFRVDLTGGATIPAWAALLLPACGFVDTADTFSPVSRPPGTAAGVKTLTMAAYIDGTKKLMRGCAGNAKFEFESGKIVAVNFEFAGIWGDASAVALSDVTILAPDYPRDEVPLRFASSGLSIGGSYTPRVGKMTLDLGGDVQFLEDSTDISGLRHAYVAGRRVNGSFDPEMELVATKDWYGIWLARTEASLAWSLGGAGNGVAFSVPKMQFRNVQEGDRNKIETANIEWQANRSADAGDDELTITIT